VGKTSLLLRFVHDTFVDRVSRFVAEEKKAVVVNGQEIVLDIWDTAGEEVGWVTVDFALAPGGTWICSSLIRSLTDR